MTGRTAPDQCPETPTLDRLAATREKRDVIREFMEWLQQNGYRLAGFQYHVSSCHCHDHGNAHSPCACDEIAAECYDVNPEQCPHRDSHTEWVPRIVMRDQGENTRYLGINQGAVDRECRAFIDFVQDQQDPGGRHPGPLPQGAQPAGPRTARGWGQAGPGGQTARRTAEEQRPGSNTGAPGK